MCRVMNIFRDVRDRLHVGFNVAAMYSFQMKIYYSPVKCVTWLLVMYKIQYSANGCFVNEWSCISLEWPVWMWVLTLCKPMRYNFKQLESLIIPTGGFINKLIKFLKSIVNIYIYNIILRKKVGAITKFV